MSAINDYIKIPEGYFFSFTNGVHSVMKKKTKEQLNLFLAKHNYVQEKENYPFLPKDKLNDFPFVEFEPFRHELFSRRQDIHLIETLAVSQMQKGKSVLEFGGWNSWLTKRLYDRELNVITVDLFEDEANGLGSKNLYEKNDWIALQADVNDDSIFIKKFDLIIFNHCLNFYAKPHELIIKYRKLLNPNGLLIILGADFYTYTSRQKQKTEAYRKYYQSKYAFKIHFYDCEGYLNMNLYKDLMLEGFLFHSYTFSSLGWIKKRLLGEKSGVLLFRNSNES